MMQSFQINSDKIKIGEKLKNSHFLEIEIYSISNALPNRNGSHFTLESMQDAIKNSYNDKPILGYFNMSGDFETHNGRVAYDPETEQTYWDNDEQILGYIREKDPKEIVFEDGLYWIKTKAIVYTKYNRKQVKRLLKDKKKKVSVEIEPLECEVVDGITYIHKFELLGITILGSKRGVEVQEGIEGAHLSVLNFTMDEIANKQTQAIMTAYQQLENKEEEQLTLNKEVFTFKEGILSTVLNWNFEQSKELLSKISEAENWEELKNKVFVLSGETQYPVAASNESGELSYCKEAILYSEKLASERQDAEALSAISIIKGQFAEAFASSEGCPADEPVIESNEGPTEEPVAEPVTECGDNWEEKYNTVLQECDQYKEQCKTYQEESLTYQAQYNQCKSEFDAYKADTEKQIETYNSRFSAISEELTNVKAENARMSQKLIDIEIQKKQDYIQQFAKDLSLTSDDIGEVIEKNKTSHYNSLEEIEKELTYIAFKRYGSKQSSNMGQSAYQVDLCPQANPSKEHSQRTIYERLCDNIK